MKNLDWIDELGDIDFALEKDIALIAKLCGIETLKKLWATVPGITLYISEKPLNELRRKYILLHANGQNTHELAVKLGVSERFVYKVMAERTKQKPKSQPQMEIFENGSKQTG